MPETIQVPSVGRAVHYFAYGTPGGEFPAGVPRAATITEVDEPGNPDSAVGLCVMNPTGLFFNQHVPHHYGPGGWDWPVYVPPVVKKDLHRVAFYKDTALYLTNDIDILDIAKIDGQINDTIYNSLLGAGLPMPNALHVDRATLRAIQEATSTRVVVLMSGEELAKYEAFGSGNGVVGKYLSNHGLVDIVLRTEVPQVTD